MMTITGSGGRQLAVEQEAQRRHLAEVLEVDLARWEAPPGVDAAHVRESVRASISRMLAEADDYRQSILAYDNQFVTLTPDEIDSGIRIKP